MKKLNKRDQNKPSVIQKQQTTISQGRLKVASIYCGLPDIRQAVGPGWMGLRTDRQYADQPD